MAKSPEAAETTMIANLLSNTGKHLDEWVRIAAGSGFTRHGEIVAFMKKHHGFSHGYANLVAHRLLKSSAADAAPEDLLDSQYSGANSGLRPMYDDLVKRISAFGGDVEFAPKKAYVSVRRAKQFAILQPSTVTRLDVGVNLKGDPPTRRLEASGSFNSMVSHRVRLANAGEIDEQLVGWLRQAYDAAG